MASRLRDRPAPPRLKTCETCFHAKIRCDRTQDSGSCDRCLRLNKNCFFAFARHGKPPSKSAGRPVRMQRAVHRPLSPPSSASSSSGAASSATVPGMLASRLLDIYTNRMLFHFPFVHLPAGLSPEMLREQKPFLYLAALAAASYEDVALQRRLGQQFNAAVADRLTHGNMASLDLLQGLLPRPRRYSQHLHLAASIVSDMRLDRPRNTAVWNIEKVQNEYLQHVVRLQMLSEQADDIPSTDRAATLYLQVYFLELLLGQMALPGFPFGNRRPDRPIVYDAQLASSLATVVSASRSLVGFLISMTPGEEFAITNMAWVMLSCGMSLAVRLDVLIKDPRIAPLTQHLVQFLDIRHSIRQIILRLESAAATHASTDTDGQNTFRQFLTRARAIESWHLQQLPMAGSHEDVGTDSSLDSTPVDFMANSNPTVDVLAGTAPGTGIPAEIGTDPMAYQSSSVDSTLRPLGSDFDFSVLDVLFDGQLPLFNPYIPGV
ncbi:hypothetical protein SEUCBS140593_006052 [Sporothrix eucalyptigena]|uniref:Zn(2)-C6 fungal-type domain-containing protein n=1 Tax=Sporothrix eucalyptigena TaxID=1812306 RepID=A0ABP0C1K0_9PEZI